MNRVIINLKTNLVFEINDDNIREYAIIKKKYPFQKRRNLLRYLKKSPQLVGVCDLTYCIFSQKLIEHQETWYTDREWVWSADLVHYTKKHYFRWPKEFISSIEEKNHRVQKIMSTEENAKIITTPIFLKFAKKYQSVDFSDDAPVNRSD